MIDLDIMFALLTFGCILFVLQMLLDYNKHVTAIRPKLNHVLRIIDQHKEEIQKVVMSIEELDKAAAKAKDEMAELEAKHSELETKHSELEIKATELREKAQTDENVWKR